MIDKTIEIFAEDMLFNLKCYTYGKNFVNEWKVIHILHPNEDSITMTYKPNIAKRMLALVETSIDILLKLDQLEQHQDLLRFYDV